MRSPVGAVRLGLRGVDGSRSLKRLALASAIFVAALVATGSARADPTLVAAYSFDEGSGAAVTDASGNNHFGTISGATWTTTGKYGGALSFNGTNASVDLGGLGTFYQSGFTVEAWVQKQTASKNDVAVLGTWTGGGGPMLWVDHLASHYQLTMNVGMSNYLDSGQIPVAGVWQHLAATFNGTTARFYIDGVEVASRTVSVSIGSSNAWRIGAYGGSPGGFFDGLIDEIRIYNRAVTTAEVQSDMNTPVSSLLGPDTTPPSAPGTVTATPGTGQVSLSWGSATDNVGVTGYDVYRSTSSGFTPSAANRIAQPTGTTYVDAGVAPGTYYYKVTAEDAAANVGPASNEAAATVLDTTPPSAPSGLAAGAAGTTVTLTWATATDDVGVLRYNVHRGTTAGFTPTAANRIAQPLGTSYTDTGLAAGTYYYKVTAEDAAGNVGSPSNEAPATIPDTTPPTTPGALTVTPAGGTANLSWIASTDDVGVVRYDVHRGLTSGFTPTSANRIAQPTGTSYSDSGLAVGTYYYKVIAEDAAGNLSPASNEVNMSVADATPPTAPAGLAATVAGNSVGLSWTASTDDVGVVRYNLHRGTSAGFTPTAANRVAQPTGTTYTDAGVPPGAYYYKVTAEDAAGNVGPASNEVTATIADTTAPTAPTGLGATTTGTSISLSWTAATDDVGVTRYNVHRATSAGFTPTTANRIAQPTGTSYTDAGLAAGTYYYKVTAQDAAGNVGAPSNEASATILGADTVPPTVSITAPGGGATLSGVFTATANASDDRGVAGVQFKVDGQNLGAEDTAAPYATDWDTRAEINGAHTLTAVARDAAGNTATSAPANVTVTNTGVSTTGLRAAYGLDQGSGTTALDSSDNHNAATLASASWTTAGRFGSAVSLNGTSSEVDPPALGTFYKSAFTYEAWVFKQSAKLDVGVVGSWVGNQNGGAMIWIDHITGDYRLTFGTSLGNYLDSGRTPAIGQWQFVAATYDGSTARIYVDGVQTATRTFTGNVGDSNAWRIGAYGSPAGGFFDGKIDNVRIYDRALTAGEIQTDMASRVQPDQTPPTVTAFTPTAGATGINVGSSGTAKFSEPMQASTITSNTVQLVEAGGAAVAATVAYNSSTYVATVTPKAALKYGTTYTVRVKGGSGGASDLFGNPVTPDATSSFTTEASPPPVLVVASTANPFSMYVTEILRNEGLDAFTTIDVSFLSPALLSGFDVVLVGDVSLNAAQVTTLTNWVTAGGNLIAMGPDKQLAPLLGLATASGNLSNAYLKVDTSAPPGAGIAGSTIQFHGTADKYTLNGATAVATLYSNATTATPNPAVTLRSVGSSGGQAAAFTYDLARSVVYTRQGNPAWAGQERDGVNPLRPDDMFYSTWLDTSRIAIPQADEQQRLLMNMITLMDQDKMPLPHFWYLPRGKKAVVVMSGDDHSPQTPGGTASNFDRFKALSPAGCVVANWECVRATSYVYADGGLTNAQAAAYVADGFEIALHPSVTCAAGTMTQSQLSAFFDTQLAQFQAKFTSIPAPATSRTHCVYWPDWSSEPKVELAHGIRMDDNYYHYPAAWIGSKPGFMNGGGFPMRFADTDGSMIDVYQQNTNMTDESGQAYPATLDALLDNALGANGYYGAFGANIHNDGPAPQAADEAIIASAQSHGVSVISYKQMLTWVDGRNGSSIRGMTWNAGTFTFSTTVAAGANGLQTLLPTQGPTGTLSALTCGGSPVTYSTQTIKGLQYAMFDTITGTCQATYS